MPHTVDVPDVGTVEFPDSMGEDEIRSVIQKQFPPRQSGTEIPRFEAPTTITPEGPQYPNIPTLQPTDTPTFLDTVAKRGRELLTPLLGETEEQKTGRLVHTPGIIPGINPFSGESTVNEPLFNIMRPQGPHTEEESDRIRKFGTPEEKATLGKEEGIAESINSLTSLNNLELAALTGGVAPVSKMLTKAIGMYFAARMGHHVSNDIAQELGREYAKPEKDRDQEKIGKLIAGGIAEGTLAAGIASKTAPELMPGLRAPTEFPEIPVTPQVREGQMQPPPIGSVTPENYRQAVEFAAAGIPVPRELPRVPFEAPLGEPTYPPSGLGRPSAELERPPTGVPQPVQPPNILAPTPETGRAAQAVREMAGQAARESDFSKAVAEKVSQEQEPPIHPDKPLTENQLRIVKDSLVQAVTDNQIPGPQEGFIAGSAMEQWADNTLRGGATHLGPDVFAAYLVKGAALLERGITTFAQWSKRMLEEYGEQVKPHLKMLFDQAAAMRSQIFTQTKGEPSAIEKGSVKEGGVGEHPGTETQRVPSETGGGNRPAPVTTQGQAPRPVLLTESGEPTTASPSGLGTIKTPIVQRIQKTARDLNHTRLALSSQIEARPVRHIMDQGFDATDNMARILGRQSNLHVSTGTTPVQDVAASAVIASGFDRNQLPSLLEKVRGKDAEAEAGVRYAMANWKNAVSIARRGKQVLDNQITEENDNGINTVYAENYLPGIIDTDMWMGHGRPYVVRSGGSGGTGFKKGKTYATPFDAIADGQTVKSLRLSELVENRVRNGQKLINRVAWSDSLRNTLDPTDGQPIVTSLIKHSRPGEMPGYEVAPPGYVRKSIIPGVDIAVHEGYARLFDALTGESRLAEFEPGGIPVVELALQLEGGLKHGLLLFDTYHVSRILQKQFFLTGRVGYRKGLTLLDYSDRDLQAAVSSGDITQQMADYAMMNRPTANLLIRNGFNVGRIQEALHTSIVRQIPIIGTLNKWIFEKMTRGAMMQAGIIEFERVQKANPTWSEDRVAQKVARDLNAYFGNLGRQGIFKSKTMQDAARLVFLAPNWAESMARSELGGIKQLVIDPALKRTVHVGSLGVGMAGGLAAYFVATQLLNLATRRQLTFQNEEKGHKLDAWIPDLTGKTPGYFLSPFSMQAEYTHDMIRYSKQDDGAIAAAAHILANKLSPISRAIKVLGTGRDWDKSKIVGNWERVKKAGVALAPTPIPLQSFTKPTGPAGQAQRQITSSLGVKTEPVETAQQQVFDLAKDWKLKSEDPKVRADVERRMKEDFAPSDYKPLKTALSKNDLETAKKEYDKLIAEGKTTKLIDQQFKIKKPFSGSVKMERSFYSSLTEQQQKLYNRALDERQELVNRYSKMFEAHTTEP